MLFREYLRVWSTCSEMIRLLQKTCYLQVCLHVKTTGTSKWQNHLTFSSFFWVAISDLKIFNNKIKYILTISITVPINEELSVSWYGRWTKISNKEVVWSGSSLFAILKSILLFQALIITILFEKRKIKCSKF